MKLVLSKEFLGRSAHWYWPLLELLANTPGGLSELALLEKGYTAGQLAEALEHPPGVWRDDNGNYHGFYLDLSRAVGDAA